MKKTLAVVVVLSAGWLALGAWVVSDLSTVKQSVETVARRQATPAIETGGYALRAEPELRK